MQTQLILTCVKVAIAAISLLFGRIGMMNIVLVSARSNKRAKSAFAVRSARAGSKSPDS